jgi:phage tail sheath protein FI
MPVTPTYPGVYIEELPSGVRTIVGVSTSVAAFVDGFTRGPLDKAVQIFNFGGFEREFGGLRSTSEASYAIQQFFLNGGSQAWVVRVTESASPAVASTGTADDEAGVLAMSLGAGRMVGGASVEDPGVWGDNLRVDIDYASKDPTNLFNMAVSEVDSAGRVVQQSQRGSRCQQRPLEGERELQARTDHGRPRRYASPNRYDQRPRPHHCNRW